MLYSGFITGAAGRSGYTLLTDIVVSSIAYDETIKMTILVDNLGGHNEKNILEKQRNAVGIVLKIVPYSGWHFH